MGSIVVVFEDKHIFLSLTITNGGIYWHMQEDEDEWLGFGFRGQRLILEFVFYLNCLYSIFHWI